MGLDATVYCDCFEKGRLRSSPPGGQSIKVSADGSLCLKDESLPLEDELEFDLWLLEAACEHENGVYLHHWLGNIALIAELRRELTHDPARFPMILEKILYNGTHAGDFIPISDLPSLQTEISALRSFDCHSRDIQPFMLQFASQMTELIAAAESMNRPISF